MRRLARAASVSLVLAVFAAVPVLAEDLVFVSAHTTWPTANPGGADEGTCFIANSTPGDVRVRLDIRVVFSDGHVQRLSGIQDPGVLGVGGAYEVNVFFIVPPDAALGPAQFVCDVTAQSLVTRRLRETEIQTAGFDVVP